MKVADKNVTILGLSKGNDGIRAEINDRLKAILLDLAYNTESDGQTNLKL